MADRWQLVQNLIFKRNKNLCFIFYASDRLNIYVKSVLRAFESRLSKVRTIIVLRRDLKSRCKLHQISNLAPVLSDVTRWSSTKDLVNCYTQLQSFLGDIVPHSLQLSLSESWIVLDFTKKLKDLEALKRYFKTSVCICAIYKIFHIQHAKLYLSWGCSVQTSVILW